MDRLNIFRSYKSDFWQADKDILDSLKVYSDQELSEIKSYGYNAIWIRAELSRLTPSGIFPEFGRNHKQYLKILRALVKRSDKYGIKVYLYFLEPLALLAKDKFWIKNKELRGEKHHWPYTEPKGYYYCLCTSTPKVKEYLQDSFYLLFKQVKGLGGVISITASEAINSCYSHIDVRGKYIKGKIPGLWKSFKQMTCPRCKQRSPAEVVAEILNTMNAGIKAASSKSQLIAWNWSWDLFYPDPQKQIISALDRDIIVMSDFERGGYKKILGKTRYMDEYSLTYTGPSQKFRKVYNLTRQTGHKFMAKVQVGTTHELGTVPNLPLITNLYRKARYITSNNIHGAMATWNFGNMRTLNTYAFGQALKKKTLTEDIFYNNIIRPYLKITPKELILLKKTWQMFGRAMDVYPLSVPFLYNSPINYAPAYWLPPEKIKGTPLGGSWIFVAKRGDDFSSSLKGYYSLNEIIKVLEIMSVKWDSALDKYGKVLGEKRGRHAQEEYLCALGIGHVLKSTWHVYKLYSLCRSWDRKKHLSSYLSLCRKELENCCGLLPVLTRDKRIGFHAECQAYMFDRQKINNKLKLLRGQIRSNDRLSEKPGM